MKEQSFTYWDLFIHTGSPMAYLLHILVSDESIYDGT